MELAEAVEINTIMIIVTVSRCITVTVKGRNGSDCRFCIQGPLTSARQHLSYGNCLEVKREYYQNCSVLDCVTQCLQSAAHLYEQFLQVQQIGFVTLGPLHCA